MTCRTSFRSRFSGFRTSIYKAAFSLSQEFPDVRKNRKKLQLPLPKAICIYTASFSDNACRPFPRIKLRELQEHTHNPLFTPFLIFRFVQQTFSLLFFSPMISFIWMSVTFLFISPDSFKKIILSVFF